VVVKESFVTQQVDREDLVEVEVLIYREVEELFQEQLVVQVTHLRLVLLKEIMEVLDSQFGHLLVHQVAAVELVQ
tara:strand:- start:287 stop:511 length:225 start_codon:yes stop_codon:yes gene_type:complete